MSNWFRKSSAETEMSKNPNRTPSATSGSERYILYIYIGTVSAWQFFPTTHNILKKKNFRVSTRKISRKKHTNKILTRWSFSPWPFQPQTLGLSLSFTVEVRVTFSLTSPSPSQPRRRPGRWSQEAIDSCMKWNLPLGRNEEMKMKMKHSPQTKTSGLNGGGRVVGWFSEILLKIGWVVNLQLKKVSLVYLVVSGLVLWIP